jgi:hypothetical protein
MDWRHTHYVECECGDAEHVLRFVLIDADGDENAELYTETQLRVWRSFWQRIFVAVKYVFGAKSKYGAYDCTMLSKGEAERLRDFLKRYIEQ